jgi:hypothetical protein
MKRRIRDETKKLMFLSRLYFHCSGNRHFLNVNLDLNGFIYFYWHFVKYCEMFQMMFIRHNKIIFYTRRGKNAQYLKGIDYTLKFV